MKKFNFQDNSYLVHLGYNVLAVQHHQQPAHKHRLFFRHIPQLNFNQFISCVALSPKAHKKVCKTCSDLTFLLHFIDLIHLIVQLCFDKLTPHLTGGLFQSFSTNEELWWVTPPLRSCYPWINFISLGFNGILVSHDVLNTEAFQKKKNTILGGIHVFFTLYFCSGPI